MRTKAGIRKTIRAAIAAAGPEELARQSRRVMARIEVLPQFAAARTVALYHSLPDEVDTHAFIVKWSREKTILLPVMQDDGYLELCPFTPTSLRPAAYGIYEPQGEAWPCGAIDMIVVPGVAFDRTGNRLGRGKGFYDRFLKRTAACKVGVCFDFQLLDEIPVDSHDVAMDEVIHGER
ncbi:MAG: 5-formyltetrahydrofolate cyclo-ligase [Rikenellaceae bacterium]|jgi:5-formyltetrahydrofolate cyclo-ligase|nr:5-formyltetrahydrofolate cyclo-ligase [Rikenellaceae bacterium]